MSTPKTAMTFSMGEDVKKDIDKMAESEQRSKSAIFRDMYRSYKFGRAIDSIQASTRVAAIKLGIETDDDVIDYLKSRGKFSK